MTFSKIFNSKGFTPLKALANLFVLIGYRSKLIASEKMKLRRQLLSGALLLGLLRPPIAL